MVTVHSMHISDRATAKDMGTVIKVRGLNALHRRFSLGFFILSNASSYRRPYIEIHRSFSFFF